MARAALLDVVQGQDEVDEGLGLYPMGVRECSSSVVLGGHLFQVRDHGVMYVSRKGICGYSVAWAEHEQRLRQPGALPICFPIRA